MLLVSFYLSLTTNLPIFLIPTALFILLPNTDIIRPLCVFYSSIFDYFLHDYTSHFFTQPKIIIHTVGVNLTFKTMSKSSIYGITWVATHVLMLTSKDDIEGLYEVPGRDDGGGTSYPLIIPTPNPTPTPMPQVY